jgi:hypothetical protein
MNSIEVKRRVRMSIWSRFDKLSPNELRILVAITAETLLESSADAGVSADILSLPPRAAASQAVSFLQEVEPAITKEQVQRLLEDEDKASELARVVLGEVQKQPALAEEIATRYDAASRKMAVPETVLLAGAILVLAMRIKNVQVTKKEVSVKFTAAGEAVKSFVTSLFKSGWWK